MRALALLLSSAVGCFPSNNDDVGGFPDAGPPPPDAAPPRCELTAAAPVVCVDAEVCPVIDAAGAECQDSIQAIDVALGDAAAFMLVRVGSDRLRAPQLFSIAGPDIAEVDARHASFADRVVVVGDTPLLITQPEAQEPILDGDGSTVADPAGELLDAVAGNDGRVHVLYETIKDALAIATRDPDGAWSAAPVADSVYRAQLAIAADQPHAVHTRSEEDAIRYQRPGEPSVEITAAGSRRGFAASFTGAAPVPMLVTTQSSRTGRGLIWVPDVADVPEFSTGSFSGLTELCTTECGSSCGGFCDERGERIAGAPRIIATADGRVWVVYVAARVDRRVRLEEDVDFIFFCSCDHEDAVERAGEWSLVLGTIEPAAAEGESPTMVERWRGPLPETEGSAHLAVATRGDLIAVAVAAGGSSRGHLFTIDVAGL